MLFSPIFFSSIHSQKDLSNRMLCWCQRAACLITSIMRHAVGHSSDGTKPALPRARNVICKCAVSLCCCHAASHCSQASNLFAVRSTLKVSEILDFFYYYCRFAPLWACQCCGPDWRGGRRCDGLGAWTRAQNSSKAFGRRKSLSLNLFPFSSRRMRSEMFGVNSSVKNLLLTTFFIYSFDIFQFIFEFCPPSSAIKVLFNFFPSPASTISASFFWLKIDFPLKRARKRLHCGGGKIVIWAPNNKIYCRFAIRFDKILSLLHCN